MTKLYVGNLPYSMTDDSLLKLFTDKGYKAVSARVITDRDIGSVTRLRIRSNWGQEMMGQRQSENSTD